MLTEEIHRHARLLQKVVQAQHRSDPDGACHISAHAVIESLARRAYYMSA
jgi:hypothetical protein